jgi:hypothetical protein
VLGRRGIRREDRVRGKMADAAADIEERGVSQTAKDLFSGAVGGIAQVLLGRFIIDLFAQNLLPHSLSGHVL